MANLVPQPEGVNDLNLLSQKPGISTSLQEGFKLTLTVLHTVLTYMQYLLLNIQKSNGTDQEQSDAQKKSKRDLVKPGVPAQVRHSQFLFWLHCCFIGNSYKIVYPFQLENLKLYKVYFLVHIYLYQILQNVTTPSTPKGPTQQIGQKVRNCWNTTCICTLCTNVHVYVHHVQMYMYRVYVHYCICLTFFMKLFYCNFELKCTQFHKNQVFERKHSFEAI